MDKRANARVSPDVATDHSSIVYNESKDMYRYAFYSELEGRSIVGKYCNMKSDAIRFLKIKKALINKAFRHQQVNDVPLDVKVQRTPDDKKLDVLFEAVSLAYKYLEAKGVIK